ncbi:MAG: hypothetical protein NVS3B20_03600 [Polyangiales bacterium]
MTNVARVFPQLSPHEQRVLARSAFVELGVLLGDALSLLLRSDPASSTLPFPGASREVLDRALAGGRGVVLVTAHLGAWERLAACLTEGGYRLTTPVKPSYDPRLEALVHAPLRVKRGVHAIDRDAPSTPRALLRTMKGGGVAGFLVDLNTRVASVRVPFLGSPAWTSVAPARFAMRTGAPIVVAIARRDGVDIQLLRAAQAPALGRIDEQITSLTARIADALGDAILAEPHRWIWMHDRWGQRRLAPRSKRTEQTDAM